MRCIRPQPGVRATLPMRFLTVFTFLQTMHYVVWCYFIPRAGRREAARLEEALADAGLVRGGRLALLVGFGVVALAAVILDRLQARSDGLRSLGELSCLPGIPSSAAIRSGRGSTQQQPRVTGGTR